MAEENAAPLLLPLFAFLSEVKMDFLHAQIAHIQRHLAFVAVEPIDWKLAVQGFSWTVTLFETYLLYVLVLDFCSSLS